MTAAKKIVTVLIALLAVFCFCFLEQTFAFCFSRVYGRKGGPRLIKVELRSTSITFRFARNYVMPKTCSASECEMASKHVPLELENILKRNVIKRNVI